MNIKIFRVSYNEFGYDCRDHYYMKHFFNKKEAENFCKYHEGTMEELLLQKVLDDICNSLDKKVDKA